MRPRLIGGRSLGVSFLNTEPLGPETVLAIVRWDDGETTRVNTANLETIVK